MVTQKLLNTGSKPTDIEQDTESSLSYTNLKLY